MKNFLSEIKDSLVNDAFAEEKKLLRKHFSVKEVHIIAGDFINNEGTREEMKN